MKLLLMKGVIKIREYIVTSMSSRIKNIIGSRFGKLEVIDFDYQSYEEDYKRKDEGKIKAVQTKWLCKCDCMSNGDELISVTGGHLKDNHTTTCGCERAEIMSKNMKKYNTYDLTGSYGIGYTNKGEEFYFDLDDYDKIKDFCWNMSDGYVKGHHNNKPVIQHRLIMNLNNSTKQVDHITGVKHDNRKANLRIVTNHQNQFNKGLFSSNTSGVSGVVLYKDGYVSQIIHNEVGISKTHPTFEEAVIYRRLLERKYFKEFRYDWNDNYEKLTNEYIENHPNWINEIK